MLNIDIYYFSSNQIIICLKEAKDRSKGDDSFLNWEKCQRQNWLISQFSLNFDEFNKRTSQINFAF